MTRRLSAGRALLAAFAVVLLSGCTAADVDAAPSASSSPTSAPTSPPEPTPTAAPAATCETVLSAEAYQKLADDGVEPRPTPHVFDALAIRMVEADGIACAWVKPSTDIKLTVVEVGVTPSDGAAWAETLGETGYVLTDDPVPGAYVGPVEPGSGISPIAVLTDASLTFVSAPTFASMLAPAA
ncbi:hypothetical protein ACFCVO_12200 [Agromyces sp. NPDC056379]|uniref:hypothetical protein n=1 Tax=unclassified Agromyces TaxID=2639701 RepID=UPI0035DF481F